jgi:hypothetical protein
MWHNLHDAWTSLLPLTQEKEMEFISWENRPLKKDIIGYPLLPSNTREPAFQIFNRIKWTNNKTFKSGLLDSPLCYRRHEAETKEHLRHIFLNYSWKSFIRNRTAPDVFPLTIHMLTSTYTAKNGIKNTIRQDGLRWVEIFSVLGLLPFLYILCFVPQCSAASWIRVKGSVSLELTGVNRGINQKVFL